MTLYHEQSLWLLTFSSSGHLTEVTDDEMVNVQDPEKLMILCTMERNSYAYQPYCKVPSRFGCLEPR